MNTQTQTTAQPAPAALQNQPAHFQGTLLSMRQTSQLSGVSEADLLDLVAYGALTPAIPGGKHHFFDISCVMKLQRAARVRQDLALDSPGFAMALMLFNEITKLDVWMHSPQRGSSWRGHTSRGHAGPVYGS